jgi:hypothetical protein
MISPGCVPESGCPGLTKTGEYVYLGFYPAGNRFLSVFNDSYSINPEMLE